MNNTEEQLLFAITAAEARIENGLDFGVAFADLVKEFFELIEDKELIIYDD